MTDDIAETDRIEQDLARTRARMDSRLDELQDKMSPSQMVNDAFAYFQGGDGADFTANLVARAKANPLPVALVGVGLVWLMASGHSRGTAAATPAPLPGRDDLHVRLAAAERSVTRADNEDEHGYAGRLDDARGQVLGVARHPSDTAASYSQRIKDAIGSATQSVRKTVHDVQAHARGARANVSTGASRPLVFGAIAAVVGLVAGSLLPTLDEERAVLGPLATKLKGAGGGMAQDLLDRGGRMANDTLAAVKDSADAHGLTDAKSVGDVVQGLKSGDLIQDAKQVAQETLKAGRESAQTHLTGAGNEPASAA